MTSGTSVGPGVGPGVGAIGGAPTDGPVALIAGSGRLPLLVVEAVERAGRRARVLALRGFAGRALRRRADAEIDLLDVAGALAHLDRWAPGSVALAGGVARPGPAALLNAVALLRNAADLRALARRGDDGLLRGVVGIIEARGHPVVGLDALAPELLAPSGVLGGRRPAEAARAMIARGVGALDALGPYDLGQAVVVAGERLLAVEGPEGTDRMLARAGRIAGGGALGWLGGARGGGRGGERGGVLVKRAKGGQDLRVDLPTIGPVTVARARAAGLAGIAVGAGTTLILDRAETIARADALGLFLVGLPPGEGG